MVRAVFGARGQIVVGVLFVVVTGSQAWYWGIHSKPSTAAIFWLSIEAIFFAAYGVVATALVFLDTEKVKDAVTED